MKPSDDHPNAPESPGVDGYYRRDVDEFHREANVLAGHDPQDASAEPPKNLTARRLLVFGILALAAVLATGIAMGLMAIPDCENPQYNWMPCLPNF
ncbi:MAG TPA: hypothetical protein VIG71_12680 [Enteractinococcus sp.]